MVLRAAILLLFVLSGMAGLIYEVLWTRVFGLVFGNTSFAVATVLSAFMLGLALGSYLFGRVVDRARSPLRIYGAVEIGIGLFALVFPLILSLLESIYASLFRSFHLSFTALTAVRFLLASLVLVIPTTLMGGTLPILTRFFTAEAEASGRSAGRLYALNTLGAVAGCTLAGFCLIEFLGMRATNTLAAAVNLGVGVLALVLAPHARVAADPTERAAPRQKARAQRRRKGQGAPGPRARPDGRELGLWGIRVVLLAYFLAGFASLGYEVLWTRILIFPLGTSAYAFTTMLGTFLLGIAIGSGLASLFLTRIRYLVAIFGALELMIAIFWGVTILLPIAFGSFLLSLLLYRLRDPVTVFGVLELMIAVAGGVTIYLLAGLERIDYDIGGMLTARTAWLRLARLFLDSAIIMLPPTILIGATFPVVTRICATRMESLGRSIGELYAANTTGCVLGSAATGFILIPWIGTKNSLVLMTGLNLVVGAGLIFGFRGRAAVRWAWPVLAAACVAIGMLIVPRDVFFQTINTYNPGSKIIHYAEGASGTVTVHDVPDGDRLICTNGVNVAGTHFMLRTTQKLQAYVPILLHENPRDVLQIGFGSGETARVGRDLGVENYRGIEICPDVLEAGVYFEAINDGSYKDPGIRITIMDGRNYMLLSDDTYDVILNDSIYPGSGGSSALYSRDHFENCRRRLKENGLLSCWVPIDLRPEEFRTIARSFQAALPHSTMWLANNCLNKHALLLGTVAEFRIDFARLEARLSEAAVAKDLGEIHLDRVYDFLDCFVMDEDALRRWTQNDDEHSDDRPYLEFRAARYPASELSWRNVVEEVTLHRSPVAPRLVNIGSTEAEREKVLAALERTYKASQRVFLAQIASMKGMAEATARECQEALRINPDDKDARYLLVELEEETKDLEEAVRRNPGNKVLRFRLAQHYHDLRKYDLAAKEYERILEIDPRMAEARNNLGLAHLGLKQFAEARAAFEGAIAIDPEHAPAHMNLGRLHRDQGRFPDAVKCLEKAITLSPDHPRPYIDLANIHVYLKELPRAVEVLQRGIRSNPEEAELHDVLAGVYLRQKRTRDAMAAIKEALRIEPGNPIYLKHREEISRAGGEGPR